MPEVGLSLVPRSHCSSAFADQTWAVVVARTGHTAKSRLAPALQPERRATLALAMLESILAACRAAGLGGTVAVVDSAEGVRRALAAGARAIREPGSGMNAAVALGVHEARARGAEAVLVLPGDVPLVTPNDLRSLVALLRHEQRAVAVATDEAGDGTNALGLRPPDVMAPAFGESSAWRHLAAGRRSGARVARLALPSLLLDVDTPEDLQRLRHAGWGAPRSPVARPASPPGRALPHP